MFGPVKLCTGYTVPVDIERDARRQEADGADRSCAAGAAPACSAACSAAAARTSRALAKLCEWKKARCGRRRSTAALAPSTRAPATTRARCAARAAASSAPASARTPPLATGRPAPRRRRAAARLVDVRRGASVSSQAAAAAAAAGLEKKAAAGDAGRRRRRAGGGGGAPASSAVRSATSASQRARPRAIVSRRSAACGAALQQPASRRRRRRCWRFNGAHPRQHLVHRPLVVRIRRTHVLDPWASTWFAVRTTATELSGKFTSPDGGMRLGVLVNGSEHAIHRLKAGERTVMRPKPAPAPSRCGSCRGHSAARRDRRGHVASWRTAR